MKAYLKKYFFKGILSLAFVILLPSLFLTGCGQSGKLYLPEQSSHQE